MPGCHCAPEQLFDIFIFLCAHYFANAPLGRRPLLCLMCILYIWLPIFSIARHANKVRTRAHPVTKLLARFVRAPVIARCLSEQFFVSDLLSLYIYTASRRVWGRNQIMLPFDKRFKISIQTFILVKKVILSFYIDIIFFLVITLH